VVEEKKRVGVSDLEGNFLWSQPQANDENSDIMLPGKVILSGNQVKKPGTVSHELFQIFVYLPKNNYRQ